MLHRLPATSGPRRERIRQFLHLFFEFDLFEGRPRRVLRARHLRGPKLCVLLQPLRKVASQEANPGMSDMEVQMRAITSMLQSQ